MKISVAKREYLVEIEVRKFTPRTIDNHNTIMYHIYISKYSV